jgi:hypothetical protein
MRRALALVNSIIPMVRQPRSLPSGTYFIGYSAIMGLNGETSAALVFLILYTILFVILLVGYIGRYLRWRSRYAIIFFHVTIRLASQASGVAFGIVGYQNINLLVAYFILGAEGYFTLVLCTYRFLIDWQCHNLACHDSWLERRQPPGTPWYKRFNDSMDLFGPKRRPMTLIHWLLIGANSIIIAGGSQLAGVSGSTDVAEVDATLHRAKILRTVGQSVFLAINTFLLYCVLDSIRSSKRENGGRAHPTLWILLVCWPLLFVRGIYGILGGVLPAFSYFNTNNYGEHGLKTSFIVSEYILSTTMEWTSCALLMLTYVTSLNDPPLEPLKEWDQSANQNVEPKVVDGTV